MDKAITIFINCKVLLLFIFFPIRIYPLSFVHYPLVLLDVKLQQLFYGLTAVAQTGHLVLSA